MTGAHTAGVPIRVFLSAAGYNRAVLQEKGPRIAGLYTYMNYVPFVNPTPAHDRYLAAIHAYAPELQPPDQEVAVLSYISTDIFLTGLLRGPACPTRQLHLHPAQRHRLLRRRPAPRPRRLQELGTTQPLLHHRPRQRPGHRLRTRQRPQRRQPVVRQTPPQPMTHTLAPGRRRSPGVVYGGSSRAAVDHG